MASYVISLVCNMRPAGDCLSRATRWASALAAAALVSSICLAQPALNQLLPPEQAVAQAQAAARIGNFAHAAQFAAEAARTYEAASNWPAAARARGLEGESLWLAGFRDRARTAWQLAVSAARQTGDPVILAGAMSGLASLRIDISERDEALAQHEEAARLARAANEPKVIAAVLANQANALARAGRQADAELAYREALERAPAGDGVLRARLAANLTRLAAERSDAPEVALRLGTLLAAAQPLGDRRAASEALLAGVQPALVLDARAPSREVRARAGELLEVARSYAEASGDRRLLSIAHGLTGRVQAANGERHAAQESVARATRLAQQLEAPELLYQWHWDAGRIHVAGDERDAAIRAYRRAVSELQAVRGDLGSDFVSGNVGYREVYGPLYYELADLLLARASAERNPAAKRALLEEARATVELSKAAELADYFQDGCVTAQQARVKRVEAVAKDVAFIYPIILRDRLELLLSHADGIEQFTVPVARDALVAEVRTLRLRLERYSTRQFMAPARSLYGWLFAPLEPALARLRISTVVIVPESALRTIPFGALHDGKDFIVRRFAFATTPGLDLTDPHSLVVKDMRVLLNGITQSVQGFDALPNVAAELGLIGGLFPGRVFKDKDFNLAAVERELGAAQYGVVHIASHGQFDSDPKRTFLLSYDDKITMNRLENLIAPSRYRDQPIELLTLSACETAAGDDRAALGLAGVAIKAGARSALASLWFINDESSAVLMGEFYRQLREPGTAKAKALQRAQLKLLDDKRFDHPAFWGPFLLIGNWL